MDFLARDSVDLPASIWESIDQAVNETARQTLLGRRCLEVYGPLGPGLTYIHQDSPAYNEASEDGFVKTTGRSLREIPMLVEDFWMTWRDFEAAERMQLPLDLAPVHRAARALALKEDRLIFFGSKFLGTEGLLTAQGVSHRPLTDWDKADHAFRQIGEGLASFYSKVLLGRYVLLVSPDLYAGLLRVENGTGVTEADRIRQMLQGKLYVAPVLGSGKAVLLCPEPDNMDLVIGKDMATSYLETVDMNHHFRIFETALLRLKEKDAVIVFE